MSVAKRVRKVEGGFDVCEGSAAGEHVVMYLLKFRPLCLIHNICSPFPLSTPLLCTLTCTCTMRCGAINSLTPSASISFKVCASLFESLSLARVLSASRAPNAVRPPPPPPSSLHSRRFFSSPLSVAAYPVPPAPLYVLQELVLVGSTGVLGAEQMKYGSCRIRKSIEVN